MTLRRYTRLERSKPIRKRKPRRLERRKEDAAYVRFVRGLDCIRCHAEGPSEAAHMPIGARGMGLKAPDSSCVPLCRACHQWFDGGVTPHATKAQRRGLAVVWVRATQLAATPTTLAEAWELQYRCLGSVRLEGGEKWSWTPSWGQS